MINFLPYLLFGIYISTIFSIMFKQYLMDEGAEPLAKVPEIFLWGLMAFLYPVVAVVIIIREIKVSSLTELKLIIHPFSWDIIPYYRFKVNTCTSELSWFCTTYSWKRK